MARPPELERAALDLLWRRGPASVREVLAGLDAPLAYTTVATVLDRLFDKGEVERHKVGAAWCYRPARTREQALAEEAAAVLARAEHASEPLLVAFLDQIEQVDPEAIDRLDALLRARRRKG